MNIQLCSVFVMVDLVRMEMAGLACGPGSAGCYGSARGSVGSVGWSCGSAECHHGSAVEECLPLNHCRASWE